MSIRLPLLTALSLAIATSAPAADWTQFRGSDGQGVSLEKGLPSSWSQEEGLIWKSALPGPGASSPVISGDKVFVTCFRGYGVDSKAIGKLSDLERVLVCISRKSGSLLWQVGVKAKSSEDQYDRMLATHGYSSSTPATDGERVYVLFGKSGVLAYDMEGKPLWQADVGDGSAMMGWGSACSPILYKDLLIVNAAAESQALVAFNKVTGKKVWESPAKSLSGCWGTPVLVDVPGGKQELVLSVPYEVWGFNPDDGSFLWFAEGVQEQAICTSVVAKDGVVYAVGGRSGGAVAIKAGGKDDVTKTHTLWRKNVGSYVTSPVVFGEHLYWVSDKGIATCLKLSDGSEEYSERLGSSPQLYASPIVADGKIYAVTRNRGAFVLAAEPKFQLLSTNSLGDTSTFNASPAVVDGQIFLRSDKFLYCIGKK